MNAFRKILFPVDFSERCRSAADWVEILAGDARTELVLLHVMEAPIEPYGPLEYAQMTPLEIEGERIESKQARLDLFLPEWPDRFNVQRVVLAGDPARRVVEFAHDQQVDLIMMPTHGYGPFRRFILGSVTAKVLHDAECPVWTAAHLIDAPRVDPPAIRRIVCAIDVDEKATSVLGWAKEMADRYGAALTVTHAVPATEARPEKYFDNEFKTALIRSVREEIADRLRDAKVEAAICVDGGDVAKVVQHCATSHHADLVFIGRSAPGLIGRLRTHGYSIIRESPCPVLSV